MTFYAPLDFSWSTRRAVARVRPTVLALVELELWPNLVRAAKRAGARVAIVNGRLSRRSHRGYRRLRGPLGPTLRRLDAVAAQTEEYAERFVDLGVPRSRVRVTGSVKYDGLETDRSNPKTARPPPGARAWPRPSWSSWPGARWRGRKRRPCAAYRAARGRASEAPAGARPPARRAVRAGRRLARRARASGCPPEPRPGPDAPGAGEPPPVILVDTIGELSAVWGLADVAFVGGSLYPRPGRPEHDGAGGLRRRRSCSARTPRTSARRSSSSSAAAGPGGSPTPRRWPRALLDDLDDPEAAAARGAGARAFVLAQNGASARTFAEIDRLVESAGRAESA